MSKNFKEIFNKLVLLSFFFMFVVYIFATSESQYAKASLANPTPRPIQIQPSSGPSIDNIDSCAGLGQNQCTNDIWCLWNGERGHCHWRLGTTCFCIPDSHVYTPTPTPTPSPTPLPCGDTYPQCNGTCPPDQPNCKNEGHFCACHPDCQGPSGAAPSCGNGICPNRSDECHYPDVNHPGCWCGPPAIDCGSFTGPQCAKQDCIWEAKDREGQTIRREGYCHWAFERCFCDPNICGDGYVEGDEECDCGNGNLDCTTNDPNCPRCRGCKCSGIAMKEINQIKLSSSYSNKPLLNPICNSR